MKRTEIHSVSADITHRIEGVEIPEGVSVGISGYTILGKVEEQIYAYIGWKVFITDISILGECSDEKYDEIQDKVEDYITTSYYVKYKQSQLPENTVWRREEGYDFDYEDGIEEREYVEELKEMYSGEPWYRKDFEIIEEKLSYVYFRMLHVFGYWFGI